VSENGTPKVDLVINTFERTYRRALDPSRFALLRETNPHHFTRFVVLINNVEDPTDARLRAQRLLDSGAIDEFHLVSELLDPALRAVGLHREELEPLLHYSDGPLLAAHLPGSPWFLYWDPEAQLLEPLDWIAPALELMVRDPRVMVANPSWETPDDSGRRPGLERETVETAGDFALSEGFSDQVFLASRTALAQPIYGQRCISRITYPGAHKAHVFEARLAAHMRHHGRLRATSLAASYVTDATEGRSSYPPRGILETFRYLRNGATLRALAISPWKPRCLRRTWL
jgi:hypothetical protein